MFLVFECFQNSEAKFTKVRTLLEEKIVFVKLGESHPRYPEFGSCLHTENCLGFQKANLNNKVDRIIHNAFHQFLQNVRRLKPAQFLGTFQKTKPWRLKRQIQAFKHQKWRLTIMKCHKTLLAFKTPKCGVYIA